MSKWVALMFGAIMLGAPLARADSVSVVKVFSFGCPVCRSSEVLDPGIKQAVQAQGGRFAYAAMPQSLDETYRELGYYAARDLHQEAAARESLYKGSQDMGLSFMDPAQVAVWLQDDAGLDGSSVAQGISSDAAKAALQRALRLAAQGGVQKYPTYLVLYQGRVVASLAPDTNGLFSLKTRVLSEISKSRTNAKEATQ